MQKMEKNTEKTLSIFITSMVIVLILIDLLIITVMKDHTINPAPIYLINIMILIVILILRNIQKG
jgi:hypothetical protein